MALFSRKSKAEITPQEPAAAPSVATKSAPKQKHASAVLLSPRITEKGAYLGELGVYLFNVAPRANKKEIAEAVHAVFGVRPRKVRVASVPRKQSLTRGTNRKGFTSGGKKAYVYLKKGDTIEIV